jgi:transcriptional regulator with XRE-family HTH domain
VIDRILPWQRSAAVDRSIDTEAHRRLCARLKRLRARAGFTQRALAERLGERQAFVSEYERGLRRLDVVELRAIAVALGGPAVAVVAQLDALDAVLAAVGDNAS